MSELRQLQEEKAALELVLPGGENQFSESNKTTGGKKKSKKGGRKTRPSLCVTKISLTHAPQPWSAFTSISLLQLLQRCNPDPWNPYTGFPTSGCVDTVPCSEEPNPTPHTAEDQTLVVRKVGVVVWERPPQNFILKDSLHLFGAYSSKSDGCYHPHQIKALVWAKSLTLSPSVM